VAQPAGRRRLARQRPPPQLGPQEVAVVVVKVVAVVMDVAVRGQVVGQARVHSHCRGQQVRG
jgi:hypothetical protein